MAYKPRWYQTESSQEIAKALEDGRRNPIAVMPTGAGKTFTICEAINLYLTNNPTGRVIVLSHVKEILQQNYDALTGFFEGIPIGLYSAGLNSRTIEQITAASIQTIYSKPQLFRGTTLIIIDECHLVSFDDKSMYRSFLSKIQVPVVGLTATPFRTGDGPIYEGPNRLFTDVCYDLSSLENYNRLVEEGFLAPLVGKNTHLKIRAEDEKVRTTAGDYNLKDLSQAFDRDAITDGALNEAIHFGKDRKLWLIFAIDIKHAENIASNLNKKGIKTACVHSKMTEDRELVIDGVKAGEYRAVVNVDVLTTGFDAPNVDMIITLRPTQSPGLHVQMLGRGARPVYSPGYDLTTIEGRLQAQEQGPKRNCLVLDFAGNIERLGPINNPVIAAKGKAKGTGEPPMKECPECLGLNYPAARNCFNCNHEFQFKQKISTSASNAEAVAVNTQQWLEVKSVKYSIHQKRGSTSSLRVIYNTGLAGFSEWICYDHKGYAGHRAKNWVRYRWPDDAAMPKNLDELYFHSKSLKTPSRILVDNSRKYPEIKSYQFEEK